jgi:hypothetical protein
MNFRNKLECLSLAGLSKLAYCLQVRPGAYPRLEHLKGTAGLKAKHSLCFLSNIRLFRLEILGSNTLAYFGGASLMRKKFYRIGPWTLGKSCNWKRKKFIDILFLIVYSSVN